MAIHPTIKEVFGLDANADDRKLLKACKEATSRACKPCWELKYCPYGPLVEDFPLLPTPLDSAVAHNEYLKSCLESNTYGDGKLLDDRRRQDFQKMVNDFNPGDHPKRIPKLIGEMACTVFGHMCPVFFVAEPFTETEEMRRSGRYIPFQIKMRVARRDNHTCQECGKHLRDDDIEFDHVIPVSKGGSSEEHNLRLTCFDCNREKSNKVKL